MKLIFYRISHDKAFLIVYLVLIPIVMGIAVYFTNTMSYQMQIGVVGDIETVVNDEIQYIPLKEIPKNSQMVLNQYDAVVYQEGLNVKVLSTKGEEYNQAIQLLMNGQIDSLSTDKGRGTASNILGFLMMVISLFILF